MKRQRGIVVVLGVLLAVVWGGVVFQIRTYVPEHRRVEERDGMPGEKVVWRERKQHVLSGKYRDPFGREVGKKEVFVERVERQVKQVVTWPTLVYRGYVEGRRERRLGIVVWNGEICFMREGEVRQGVRLKLLEKGYMVVEQQGERRQIEIEKEK